MSRPAIAVSFLYAFFVQAKSTVEIDLNAKETQDFSMRATERATTDVETSRAAFFI
ncbi:hypothetical protein MUO79_09470 [Candidatus Bathyarchaeota archaeon]|nr:hypothetical protein [Candidatus Bathyarchaeota archaeon]